MLLLTNKKGYMITKKLKQSQLARLLAKVGR